MKKLVLSLCSLLPLIPAAAQYAPQAGMPGSTAVSASSPAIVAWASGCSVQRGYIDIADKSLGHTSAGSDADGAGSANGTIVSLGDSGIATLTFAHPLFNGPGADFAVFENGFKDPADASMAFLELAFVEVSSDGENFFRFPPVSNTPVNMQIPVAGVYMDATRINNLAGKYVATFGTPFDLQELAGTAGLDVNNITHVRLVDVIGAVSGHSSLDIAGHKINDPYPTAIPTGGFDLDAVGAIHMQTVAVHEIQATPRVQLYPVPADNALTVSVSAIAGPYQVAVIAVSGSTVYAAKHSASTASIDLSAVPSGFYFLTIQDGQGGKWVERFIKR